jgi:hypothetical protein
MTYSNSLTMTDTDNQTQEGSTGNTQPVSTGAVYSEQDTYTDSQRPDSLFLGRSEALIQSNPAGQLQKY